MKKISLLILVMFLSYSCKDISGNLEVFETITLLKKGKGTVISPGTYSGKVKFKSKKKIKLKINKKKYTFKIPSGTIIPKENGELRLSASQVGQPYDLYGLIETHRSTTSSREAYESCSWSTPYTVCSAGPNGNTQCHTYYHTYYGQKLIRFHNLTIDKNIKFILLTPSTDDNLAEFIGREVKTRRVYEYTGLCR